MKKFTLVDTDISTVKEHDGANNSANRLKQLSKAGTVVLALALGSTTLTGCFSDPANCTDSDVGADPYVYDLGPNEDPYDFGGDTDTGSGDPVGSGRSCVDSD